MGKQAILIHKKSSPLPEWLEQTNRIEYENVSDLIDKLKEKFAAERSSARNEKPR